MAAWPSDVPTEALFGTIAEQLDENLHRFTPEVGPDLTRAKSTVVTSRVEFQVVMTAAQRASLEAFYLNNRALVFTRVHPDPTITGIKNWKFLAAPKFTGFALNRHLCALTFCRLP